MRREGKGMQGKKRGKGKGKEKGGKERRKGKDQAKGREIHEYVSVCLLNMAELRYKTKVHGTAV